MATPRWPDVPRKLERDVLEIVEVNVTPRPKLWPFGLLGTSGPPAPTVRRFADSKLQDSIDKVLEGLPDESRAVELSVAGNAQGVTGVIAVKLSSGWSLAGGVNFRPGGEWSGQVSARRVWA